MVSLLVSYSDILISNPNLVYNFSVKMWFKKWENLQKEDGVGPFKKTHFAVIEAILKTF